MKFENQNILIVSNEPWGELWFTKHNYANELSKRNNVIFINSPFKWKPQNIFKNKIKKEKEKENFSVLSIQNYLPALNTYFIAFNNFIATKRLRKFLKRNKYNDYILWSFTPLFLYNPKLLKCKLSIFHVADLHWTKFHGTDILSTNADFLFFISKHILPEYSFTNKPKLILHHGISSEEYEFDSAIEAKIKEELISYGKFGLFIGSIDNRLNFDLIYKMSQKFQKVNFLFVGPIKVETTHNYYHLFKATVNIYNLGIKPYKILKYYIQKSHFCISPMDINYPGNDISHHKTISYLAQGKPIFSPVFKEYLSFENLLYMNNSDEILLNSLDQFLKNGEDDSLYTKRIDLSKYFLFEKHIERAENYINEIFKG
ncbi:MAG: hypothetical protein HYX39_06575 [Bacteroidetes bacterium]|nr:hypothetical protein [Bacteroidota bacterium]